MSAASKILMLIGFALVSTAASADAYIGVAGGMGISNAGDKIEQQTGYDSVNSKDNSKSVFSLYGAYALNERLAIEVAYTDFGKYRLDGSYNGYPAADSLSAQALTASLVGTLPLSPLFGLEGKAGLGSMNQKYQCERYCTASMQDSTNTSTIGVLGIGAYWKQGRNLTLRTRYDYFGEANSPLRSEEKINYSLLSVGVDWHF
ncbi:outer membrane beta-barrel protein [Niveibacterium terrae]|uniref:outer membrane beta-barrel protein n=1 Tax=Niveibacterium terrae TaxID=3373598 RepID=UPI003A8D0089